MIVVVTGGTGFFGSHLIRGLLDNGHHVILLKRSTSDLWRIKEFVSEIDMFDIDVTPLDVLYDRHPKIDACIHTATDYGHINDNINDIFQTNVSLPFRLLSSLHSAGCKLFINTDTFYTFSHVQHDYMHMKSYILSKKHFREIGEKFSSLGNIKFINMKLFHLYGTMDGDKKFTTTIIKQLIKNEDIKLTEGTQSRDFIYVDDAVRAFLTVLESNNAEVNQHYDVGTGCMVSIRDFVQIVQRISKSKSKLLFGEMQMRNNEYEVSNISAEISELNKLGWFPETSLEQGIGSLINYLAHSKSKIEGL